MIEVAQRAGEEAMRYYGHLNPGDVTSKSTAKDLVSVADKAVEALIIKEIRSRYSDHDIFGEESGQTNSGAEYCWIIDPIDGTQSFVKQHPFFAVSIALTRNDEAIFGVVYAPALNLLFTAERGKGAFRNGVPIHVSGCQELSEAACSTGFACLRAGMKRNNLPLFTTLAPKLRDVQRCGSAALDLCFLACGTYDAIWELMLARYDIAAGKLIAEEAGAHFFDMTIWNYPSYSLAGANEVLLAKLVAELEKAAQL